MVSANALEVMQEKPGRNPSRRAAIIGEAPRRRWISISNRAVLSRAERTATLRQVPHKTLSKRSKCPLNPSRSSDRQKVWFGPE